MIRYASIFVFILMAMFGIADASVPSVDQLLDRFASNADRYSGSFMIKLESDREVNIERMDHTYFKPGKRKEHYSVDCRWDGKRLRLRRRVCIGPGTTKVDYGEQVTYEDTFSDSLEHVTYGKQVGRPDTSVVKYYDMGQSRESRLRAVEVNVGSWAWGYFPDEDPARIDGFLRWSPTARVRPRAEPIDNSECYVLEANTRNAKYTIWFDPAHGYNFAKLRYEQPGAEIVVANRLFKQYEEAWIPMETEWEVRLNSPESDVSYSQKTIVKEFKLNPDHEMLQSFVLDDIPEGTRVEFHSGKGYQMPGEFEWHHGKPGPCVAENTLVRLNRAAESIIGHAARISTADTMGHSSDGVSTNGASSAPHCGLHCVYLLRKFYGQDPNFVDLVTPAYLDTPKGSTLSALKTAVEDADLHAEIMLRANTRVLRSCPDPAILRVRGSELSKDYDHYILFLGTEGPWARICNPPGSVRLVSLDELASRWDGSGLVVADKPIQLAGMLGGAKTRLFLIAGVVLLAMLVIARVRRQIVWPQMWSGVAGRSALSAVQFGGLAVAALVIGLVFHSVSKGGFLRYPEGVASIQRAHIADFIPRIDLSTAKDLKQAGGVFIDARGKRDFDAEHVDGAISIPVDANDVVRREAMKALPLSIPIVVYCQSEMCQFADIVAGKIRLDGFSNVSILPGGWVEWKTGVRLRIPRSNKDSKSRKWRLNSDGTASPI